MPGATCVNLAKESDDLNVQYERERGHAEVTEFGGLKVAIVSRIYLPEPGAASFRLSALAKTLRDRGANTSVITTRPPAGYGDELADHDGIQIRRSRVLRDPAGYVRGYIQYLSFDIPAFFRTMFRARPDIILVEPPPTTGVVVRIACALRRIPYVYYAADIWSDAVQTTNAPRAVVRAVRLFERWAMQGAKKVVSVSDEFSKRIVELGVTTPMKTVGNGVDTTLFSPDGERHALDGPYLLYAGTASEVHGATIFLRAFSKVLANMPDARLVFIGQGAERDELKRLAAELPSNAVRFEDRLSSSDVAEWIRGADATLASVHPAGYHRAFPTKMYASVACGTRVVYAGAGPGSEFARVPGVGWSVDYDVDAVAVAMIAAFKTPHSQEERASLSAWARDNVSLAAVADRVSVIVAEAARDQVGRRD